MVDNKSKTSIIRHIQKKNISLMKINNIHGKHSYYIAIFIRDIFFLCM